MFPNLSVHVGLRCDQEDVRRSDGTKIYNSQAVDANGNVIQAGGPAVQAEERVAAPHRHRVGPGEGRLDEGLGLVRPLLLRPADRPHGPLVRRQDRRHHVQLQLRPAQRPSRRIRRSARQAFTQGGFNPEPFQDNLKGIYQDEYALGFEKALSSSLSVAVRYTYRNLGRTIEDRCDFDAGYPEANGNTCVIINPGSSSPFATGQGVHTCDGRDYIDASGNSVAVAVHRPPDDERGHSRRRAEVPRRRVRGQEPHLEPGVGPVQLPLVAPVRQLQRRGLDRRVRVRRAAARRTPASTPTTTTRSS